MSEEGNNARLLTVSFVDHLSAGQGALGDLEKEALWQNVGS